MLDTHGLHMPRALVAVCPDARRRIAVILRDCEVTMACAAEDVEKALTQRRFDLLIVDVHFDDSTALELVTRVLRMRIGCPVICMRCVPFRRCPDRTTFEAFLRACEELGANEVLDLLEFPDDDYSNLRVRRMLDHQLLHHA
jgi:CheY-like chemotaxis protein